MDVCPDCNHGVKAHHRRCARNPKNSRRLNRRGVCPLCAKYGSFTRHHLHTKLHEMKLILYVCQDCHAKIHERASRNGMRRGDYDTTTKLCILLRGPKPRRYKTEGRAYKRACTCECQEPGLHYYGCHALR